MIPVPSKMVLSPKFMGLINNDIPPSTILSTFGFPIIAIPSAGAQEEEDKDDENIRERREKNVTNFYCIKNSVTIKRSLTN